MKSLRFLIIPILVTAVLAQADDFHVYRDSLRAAYSKGDGEARLAATEAVATFRNLDSTVLLVSFIKPQYAIIEKLLEEREAIRTGRDKSLKGARPEPYLASLKERLDLEFKVLAAVEEGFAKLTDVDAIRYLAKTTLPKHKHWKARE
ncbi:MAG: hypothetical protein ABFS86_13890, partial [Planctomycetota bacterium]